LVEHWEQLLLLVGWARLVHTGLREGCANARGYSAATTTTATTRDAAQVDCAALGERELEAG
jgi:hypothetical protein